MNTFDCVPLGQTITIDFVTHGTTGAVSDADSTPTSEVFEETNDTGILTPTVTKRTSKTGNYRLQVVCTAANGFEIGKSYSVVASATVGGIAGKAVVASFMIGAPFYYGAVVADAGNTTTQFKANRTDAEAGTFSRHSCVFVTGTLAGQCCKVYNFNPATDFFSVRDGYSVAPTAGDVFVLLPLAIGMDSLDSSTIQDLVVTYGENSLANEVTIMADTDDIQSRLPAALDGSGFMKSQVKGMDANTIDAAAIKDAAIDAAAFAASAITSTVLADNAITAAKIADGAIDAATFAAGAINAAAVADGTIDAATFAAGAITAAAIATDAIDADALAADAVAEIQSGLATAAGVAGVQTDVDDIQARLPAALVGGRIDASVGAMANNTLTAAALAADAGAEIADAVWDEDLSGHAGAGTAGKVVSDAEAYAAANNSYIVGTLDAAISTRASAAALAAAQADIDALQLDTAAILSDTAAIHADTDDIQSRLPAALDASGNMKAQVKGIDNNSITAASIAADAITAAKVADGTIDAATFAAGAINAAAIADNAIDAGAIADGSITAAKIADNAITAAKIADAAIDAATFAAGAIDNAAIATDAIGAAEISAAAVTKIQTGLATALEVAAVQTDVDDIQSRLPAALIGGRIDAHVGAIADDAITAASIAADAITAAKFAADACDKIVAALYASTVVDGGVGTFGRRVFCRSGTVQTDAGNNAITFLTDLTETDVDYWKDVLLVFEDGDLVDQVKKVTAYDGAGGITVGGSGYTATPADGTPFTLINK